MRDKLRQKLTKKTVSDKHERITVKRRSSPDGAGLGVERVIVVDAKNSDRGCSSPHLDPRLRDCWDENVYSDLQPRAEGGKTSRSAAPAVDHRSVDDLLSFINGPCGDRLNGEADSNSKKRSRQRQKKVSTARRSTGRVVQ